MTIEQILEYVAKVWGSIQHFIAGFIGASIVSYYYRDQLKTRLDFVIFILSGAFIAQYLTKLCVHLTQINAENAGGVSFLLGAFGGLIIQQIVSYITSGAWKEMSFRQYFIAMMKEWLNRKK